MIQARKPGMGLRAASLFKGWRIITRCTEFHRQDGSKRFVSTAELVSLEIGTDRAPSSGRTADKHSTVHTEDAFCTCEEARADVLARAHRSIIAANDRAAVMEHDAPRSKLAKMASSEPDANLAEHYEITFDGMRYAFRGYHYTRFQDALRYAMMQHMKSGFLRDEVFVPSWMPPFEPSDEEERKMLVFGIAYDDCCYQYAGYRYGRLSDAIEFARGHPFL